MISLNRFLILALPAALFTSCVPFPPRNAGPSAQQQVVQEGVVQAQKSQAELKAEADRRAARIKANKEAAKRRAAKKARESGSSSGGSSNSGSSSASNSGSSTKKDSGSTTSPETKKPASRVRTASKVPGKPGFVFNPWTGGTVDARAVPTGSKIRDPNDGDPSHVFRVP